jgi:Mn2+/Fe2+ NRAMP family transporter
MLADADPGNVVVAAEAGARWGYRLLPLLFLLIPVLYMVQELAARLGCVTGRGHGELIRAHFGPVAAWISAAGLTIAAIGSLVTEFTGIAGVGELYGVPRSLTLPLACATLIAIVSTGSYRRAERIAILIGLFEGAFVIVAALAHPDLGAIARDSLDLPLNNPDFAYLGAALIGAVFNPWMVFYQQSATVEKGLDVGDYRAVRWDTAMGAAITQILTASALIAIVATIGGTRERVSLGSIGEISQALTQVLGAGVGQLIFSLGVMGAATVAAIVASLALAWGLGELSGHRRSLESSPSGAPWFYAVYGTSVLCGAAIVWLAPDLVTLIVAAQALNAFLLPMVIGFLIALAAQVLPAPYRLEGWRLWLTTGVAVALCAIGLLGALRGVG